MDSFRMGQIKGRKARNDGILEIADDKTVSGEESFYYGFYGRMFLHVLFQCAKLVNGIVLVFL